MERQEVESAECPLCGSRRWLYVGTVLAGDVVRCLFCGLGRASGGTRDGFDAEPYDEGFFEEFTGHEFASTRNVALVRHLDEIERLRPNGRRMLDVGTAIGDFVRLATARGWEVTGIEPALPAVEVARSRGVHLLHGTLEDLTVANGSFDAVHLSHVVEHLPDPFAGLRRVRDLVAPGGVVAIEVPNELDNLFQAVRAALGRAGAADRLTPEHLWFFSPSTVTRALTDAGFAVASLRTRNWTPLSSRLPLGGLVKRVVDSVSTRLRRGELIEVYGRVPAA